jgi:hypothetical protein
MDATLILIDSAAELGRARALVALIRHLMDQHSQPGLSVAKSGNGSPARNAGPGFHFVQSGLRLLDQSLIFLYSLKYGNIRRRRGFGRSRPG